MEIDTYLSAGVDDDVEERKLGELVDTVGGGTPSTDTDEYWGGSHLQRYRMKKGFTSQIRNGN